MKGERRLLCVLAHPDDETLGTGGTLAKYAAEGVATYLVTATRGEQGWPGEADAYPGPQALGRTREAELCAAARVLGLRSAAFLDYIDGELDQADPGEVIAKIVTYLRQVRPQVVITFGPDGATGHPDHIAISQLTTAAVVYAAGADNGAAEAGLPHQVAKLYYLTTSRERVAEYNSVFGGGSLNIDGVERRPMGWDEWTITARINTAAYWQRVRKAVACHRTQLRPADLLEHVSDAQHRMLWGTQEYYRAFSVVNGGRVVEEDLFAGVY